MRKEMTPRHQADDGGFTVVEILISSAILFFVATALFGLVATSTMLSATAKTDTVAVNAANTFLEEVRRQPFNEITQAWINSLATDSATTVDGVSVVLSATVTDEWLQGQNPAFDSVPYRRVALRVTATGPTGRPFVFNTGTFVGNFTGGAVVGAMPPGTPPTDPPGSTPRPVITILDPTPTSGVVRGSSVFMGMDAAAGGPAVSLSLLRISIDGQALIERSVSDQSATLSTHWNTFAVGSDATPLFRDGSYPVQFSARDTLGQLTFRQWSLIVDNHPPNPPGTPTITAVTGNTAATHTWATAMDGRDPAAAYRFVVNQQSQTAATFVPVGTPFVTSTNSLVAPTESFRRYRFDVSSLGPEVAAPMVRHESSAVSSAFYISRPSFTGTPTVGRQARHNRALQFSVTLTSDAPRFQTQGAITYRWQYRESWATNPELWVDLGTTNPLTVTNRTAARNGAGWFEIRCVVTVTPAGGTPVSVPSVVVRYTVPEQTDVLPQSRMWDTWSNSPATTPAINWGMWP